jgi:hypothetical protein
MKMTGLGTWRDGIKFSRSEGGRPEWSPTAAQGPPQDVDNL